MRAIQWLALATVASGCTSSSSDDTQYYFDASCGEACADRFVGSATLGTLIFLWNQNLAGQPTGAQNKMVNCAFGGTVHITGTTGYDNGTQIATAHIVYDLAACHHQDTSFSMTFTGMIAEDGTFSPNATSLAYTTDPLVASGTAGSYQVGATCALNMTRSKTSVSGQWCGRPFSY